MLLLLLLLLLVVVGVVVVGVVSVGAVRLVVGAVPFLVAVSPVVLSRGATAVLDAVGVA